MEKWYPSKRDTTVAPAYVGSSYLWPLTQPVHPEEAWQIQEDHELWSQWAWSHLQKLHPSHYVFQTPIPGFYCHTRQNWVWPACSWHRRPNLLTTSPHDFVQMLEHWRSSTPSKGLSYALKARGEGTCKGGGSPHIPERLQSELTHKVPLLLAFRAQWSCALRASSSMQGSVDPSFMAWEAASSQPTKLGVSSNSTPCPKEQFGASITLNQVHPGQTEGRIDPYSGWFCHLWWIPTAKGRVPYNA